MFDRTKKSLNIPEKFNIKPSNERRGEKRSRKKKH